MKMKKHIVGRLTDCIQNNMYFTVMYFNSFHEICVTLVNEYYDRTGGLARTYNVTKKQFKY